MFVHLGAGLRYTMLAAGFIVLLAVLSEIQYIKYITFLLQNYWQTAGVRSKCRKFLQEMLSWQPINFKQK